MCIIFTLLVVALAVAMIGLLVADHNLQKLKYHERRQSLKENENERADVDDYDYH